jgi:uncharacterized protein YceH (UPF0502 family)
VNGEVNRGEQRAGSARDDAVTQPAAGTSEPAADETAEALAREVYWAGGDVSRLPSDVGSLRERLDAFAHQLRVEQRELVPIGETMLGSAVGWKRRTKLVVWRLTRFSTARYDRLIADLAEMNGELAARLGEIEAEVARLREELEGRGADRP